jgi:hypothetical protein
MSARPRSHCLNKQKRNCNKPFTPRPSDSRSARDLDREFMADLKFSCGECGQHISCDESWSGHQIQCPACQASLTVPQLQSPPETAVPDPRSLIPQPPAVNRPKLSAGLTQVARSTPPAAAPQQRRIVRPPKTRNSLIGYAILAVMLVVVGVVAYNYVPALLNQVQDIGSSKTTGSGAAPVAGGRGPLGEMNGAMDVSDALDGGGSAPRAGAARPRQAPGTLTTNSAARPPNGTLRGQPGA